MERGLLTDMFKYFSKKMMIYILTFFIAVSINWAVPRFMPGDPITQLLARFQGMEGSKELLRSHFVEAFKLGDPLIVQFFKFWKSVFQGDLGVSIRMYPRSVLDIILSSAPYDMVLFFPAVILSLIIGNKLGAYSGFNKKADSMLMPFIYFLRSAPYFWFAIVTIFVFGHVLDWFPTALAYDPGVSPGWNLEFIVNALHHWILPFSTMFLVELGGWAIGMKNMVIYEKKAGYAEYMRALGAGDGLIRKYAFRNGVLPQITGLALRIGKALTGAVFVESIFSYPGVGYRMLQAIQQQDYFLLQGCFLAIVAMTLAANFIVDIVYMFVDPKIRLSYSEGE